MGRGVGSRVRWGLALAGLIALTSCTRFNATTTAAADAGFADSGVDLRRVDQRPADEMGGRRDGATDGSADRDASPSDAIADDAMVDVDLPVSPDSTPGPDSAVGLDGAPALDSAPAPDSGVPGNALLWLTTFGDKNGDLVRDIAVDGSSLLVVGSFWNALDLGGTSKPALSKGKGDAFVAKFDSAGKVLWLRTFGGATDDGAQAVALGPSGRIYVTGYGQGSVDYGLGTTAGKGGNDIFVLALDPQGKTLWVDRSASSGVDDGADIAADAKGDVFVTGSFYGSVTFAGKTMVSAGSSDISLFKFDSTGKPVWSKRFGGAQLDDGRALAVDVGGDVWLAGIFRDKVDFGGVVATAKGSQDIVLLHLSGVDGAVKLRRYYGGAGGYNQGNALAVDPKNGDVLCAGSFVGSEDFGTGKVITATGSRDPFIVRLDKAGALQKVVVHKSSGSGEIKALDVSASGRVVAVGTFTGSYDAGSSLKIGAASGLLDGFALRFAASGKPTLLQRYGGTGADAAFAVAARSNDMIVGGYFNGMANFLGQKRTAVGASDAFLLAVGP
jgi:hypothetical protein